MRFQQRQKTTITSLLTSFLATLFIIPMGMAALPSSAPAYDGNLVSLWAGVRAEWYRFSSYERSTVTLPELLSPLPISKRLKRDSKNQIVRAPLVIYLPGLFSRENESMTLRSLWDFSKPGYHVVAIPNPWSRTYASRLSPDSYLPGAYPQEAKAILTIIPQIIQEIGPDNISRISLIGESYGAFLSSVVLNQDAAQESPLIDGPILLLAPPLNIAAASAKVDQNIAKLSTEEARTCENLFSKSSFFLQLFLSSDLSSLRPGSIDFGKRCSEIYVAQIFQSFLWSTYRALPLLKNEALPPQSEVFFESLGRTFSQENVARLQNHPEESSLDYWLSGARPEALSRLKIISAQDDFLNVGLSWDEFSPGRNHPGSVKILDWGGHFGFAPLPEFIQWVHENLP